MTRRAQTHGLRLLVVALGVSQLACAGRRDVRGLHYIGDQLVESSPADHRSYDAYIRARMAMEASPPDLEGAHRLVMEALYFDRDAPQLWTARAEIELKMGKLTRAAESSRVALSLRPGYPPARSLMARISRKRGAAEVGSGRASASASAPASGRP